MADTATAPAAANAPAAAQAEKGVKPAKPDEAVFKKEVDKAEREHKAVMTQLNAIKEKIEIAMPNKNKENQSPTQKRRQELISELTQIRQKQAGFKNSRASRTDQIKRLDEQMRSRIAEQNTNRAKVPYKSVEELDAHVNDLERQVESGRLKIVDEKKALSEITAAKKMRKTFAQFDEGQKAIDEIKAKIKDLKDSGEDPEQKKMSERYSELQKELDVIKAQSDEAFKSINSLRDERSKLQAEQQEKFQAIRKIKDDFYAQKRAFNQYERDAKEKARERQRAERERIVKERKKADAERFLEEASNPAFLEEMRRANSLLQFLDPSTKAVEKAPLLADSGMAAQAQRKVDDSGMKGMKIIGKQDREEEYLPAVKKGKKGKKNTGGAGEGPSKFNCPPSVVEDCSYLGVDPPMSQAEVPTVVEKVKAKLAKWKEDQESETKKNIEKARKELERLEKEGEQEGENRVNGSKKVDEVASKMEETTVKDTKE